MRAYREPRQPPSPLRYAALARPTTAPAHSRTVPTALAAAFRADTVTPLPPASTLTQVTGFRYAALAPYLHEPPTTGPPAGHIRATRAPLRPLACPTRHDERHSRVTEMPTPRRQLRFRRSRFSGASPWHEPAANSRASARTRRKPTHLGTNQPQAHPPRHETAASFGASAPDRRGLFRPSTQPTGPRPFRADTVTPLTPASTLPQVTGFRYAALAPYLHAPPTAGPIRAAYGQPGPPRPGTAHEITIHGLDRDLVGDAVEAPSTRSRLTARIAMSWASWAS